MSRRLPLCAVCGKPLTGTCGRVVETWTKIPGQPAYGWHLEPSNCFDRDASALAFNKNRGKHTLPDRVAFLDEIEKRGPGRVVRLKVAA